MATGYNLTNLDNELVNYLEAHRDELIAKSIFNNHASDMFTLQTGVKNPTALISVDIKTPIHDGSECSFSPDGTDNFSDRVIEPAALTVQKEFCPKDLLGSWKSRDIAFTAGRETMPYEEFFMEKLAENISAEVENLIINGRQPNDPMTGLMSLIDNDITSGVIPAGNVIAKGTDDILTRCQKLWEACSPEIMKDAEIWMSIGMYKNFILFIQNSDFFQITAYANDEFTLVLPGTNTVIRGISSMLDSDDTILMLDPKNVVKSVDVENATEQFDFWYSKDDQVFKFNWFAYIGVQYADPERIYVNR